MPELSVLEPRPADSVPLRASGVTSDVVIAVYDALETIERDWRDLEQSAEHTGFQSFDWLAAWCEHVGRQQQAQPAIVVGRGSDGDIMFILPLMVLPGAVRRLTFLASDLCDYNGPILAKDFAAAVTPGHFMQLWQDIQRLLQADSRFRHDIVELTKMPGVLCGRPHPLLALRVGLNPSNAYVADLAESWDAFYAAKRSSATRRRDRTKLKRLSELGAVTFVTPQRRDDIEQTMTVLFEQKSRSLKRMGAPDIFARPGWREFYAAVATNPRTRHLVHVSRLDAGTIYTAINLGLTFRDSYYHVLVSHDDGDAARFGPGVAHLRELMRYAIERGLRRFDFTIGDERYKSEWADHKLSLYDHVAAASVRGLLAKPLILGHRRLKRFIKQNESLWSAFTRARAAVGSKSSKNATTSGMPSPPIAPE